MDQAGTAKGILKHGQNIRIDGHFPVRRTFFGKYIMDPIGLAY
jgi:hypothetical protein